MASFQKHPKGYRAQIKLTVQKGAPPIRDSRIFPTKREAQIWASMREQEIRESFLKQPKSQYTLLDAMRKYADEVSPDRKGYRWESVRLIAFERYNLPVGKPLGDITSSDIAAFRDSRLKEVTPSSVRREIALLSSVFESARVDWGWSDFNPCKEIRRPTEHRHRERVLQWWEIKRMLRAMGHNPRGRRPHSSIEAIAICMLFALRTGMRAGELTALTWDNVSERHCHLPSTKTGRPRDVPLSKKAAALLERMAGWDSESVFGLKPQSLSTLFRRYRMKEGLEGFTFHDTRHTAATMISKKVSVLDLCKIFGWTDPKMAMVYYNPHASSLADLLD